MLSEVDRTSEVDENPSLVTVASPAETAEQAANAEGLDKPEFDKFADSYDDLLDDPTRRLFAKDPLHFHRRKVEVIERILKQLRVPMNILNWLDVGCGRGDLLKLAGDRFRSYSGCDVSPEMLRFGTTFEVRCQPSAVELPYPDSTLDFVTAVCVFHHVHGQDRILLLKEIRRVLTTGGLFCLIEHEPRNPVTRSIVRRCPVDADAELVHPRTARRLFRAVGLEEACTRHFLFFPESLFGVFRPVESAMAWLPYGGQYAMVGRAI
jgi:SAM-dependent methyltransferase